jgi:hypothetical protein
MTGFITRKKIAAATAATAIGVGGVIAYAAWTSSGAGVGTVSARSASALVVADATTATTLYPTGKADLVVTLTNSNAYKVSVSAITLGALASGSPTAAAISADGSHSTCNVASVTYTAPTIALDSIVVGANGGTYTVTLHNAVAMDNSANDNCQGATFTVPVVATAASSSTAASSPNSGSF